MQLFSMYLVHKTLYMFQAAPPPIIRSTKLYIRQVFVKQLLLPAAIVEDKNDRTQNLAFLSYWYRMERLQIHF